MTNPNVSVFLAMLFCYLNTVFCQPTCTDKEGEEYCRWAASQGYCTRKFADWMTTFCSKSCGCKSPSEAPTSVDDQERPKTKTDSADKEPVKAKPLPVLPGISGRKTALQTLCYWACTGVNLANPVVGSVRRLDNQFEAFIKIHAPYCEANTKYLGCLAKCDITLDDNLQLALDRFNIFCLPPNLIELKKHMECFRNILPEYERKCIGAQSVAQCGAVNEPAQMIFASAVALLTHRNATLTPSTANLSATAITTFHTSVLCLTSCEQKLLAQNSCKQAQDIHKRITDEYIKNLLFVLNKLGKNRISFIPRQ